MRIVEIRSGMECAKAELLEYGECGEWNGS